MTQLASGWTCMPELTGAVKPADLTDAVLRFQCVFAQQSNARSAGFTFTAPVKPLKPLDLNRHFVLSLHAIDGSVSVIEEGATAHVSHGKFLEKIFTEHDAADFFVGAEVAVNGSYRFQLLKADQFTLRFMETYCNVFPMSNAMAVLAKVTGVTSGTGTGSDGKMNVNNESVKAKASKLRTRLVVDHVAKGNDLSAKLQPEALSTLLKECGYVGADEISAQEVVTLMRDAASPTETAMSVSSLLGKLGY